MDSEPKTFDPIVYGPKDPSLWLRRPLGAFEVDFTKDFDGLPLSTSCTLTLIAELVTHGNRELNIDNLKQAVMATVYHEPHLRADVDLNAKPPVYVPATDFNDVFHYKDKRSEGYQNFHDSVPLIEAENEKTWKLGCGKPLYRCLVFRVATSYLLLNTIHHAVGDAVSHVILVSKIMTQYHLFQQGKGVACQPLKPKPCFEDICLTERGSDTTVEKLVQFTKDRLATAKDFLPFNRPAASICKSIFKDGDSLLYSTLREIGRKEKVTVGARGLAACFFAFAAFNALHEGKENDPDFQMDNEYIMLLVGLRQRFSQPFPNTYFAMMASSLFFDPKVTMETEFWDLTCAIRQDLLHRLEEKQHFASPAAAAKASELFGSDCSKSHDLFYSDVKEYPSQLSFGDGRVNSIHITSNTLLPRYAKYAFFISSTDRFHYDLGYLHDPLNKATAMKLLDMIHEVMESELSNDFDHICGRRLTLRQFIEHVKCQFGTRKDEVVGTSYQLSKS